MGILRICVLHTFLTVLLLQQNNDRVSACSSGCTCTTVTDKPTGELEAGGTSGTDEGAEGDDLGMPQDTKGRKVDCSNNPYRFTSIEDVNRAITIPLDTIYLDLRNNEISVLRKESFSQLSDLQRLNLSHNRITLIEPGAFEGLSELRRLDLSDNNLGSINGSIFSGLPNLQKLMLSNNKLNTIPDGTFNDLPALRRLDFRSDYLRCDCHLKWIVKWTKLKKVKIKSSTACAVPRELKGTVLKRLKQKDLHCDRPLELPLFEIKPGMSQIVFEGDKLPFDCQASVVDPNTKMFWLRRGTVVETNRSQGIFIHTRKTPDNTVMMHSLVLEDLKSPQSGEWLCLVSTPQGNVTKTVTIVVIDSNAPQCEKNTTKTNKGVYMWEATVAGVTKELPCKLGDGMITHICDKLGRWTKLNHTACEFTDEVTRRIQIIAKKGTNSSKILTDAKNLETLVSAPFRNNEDPLSTVNPEYVDMASLAIYRLSQRASVADKIVKSVLFCASKIMNISTSILNEAQRQSKSLSRISKAVESIPQQMKNQEKFSQSDEFIVIEARQFSFSQFRGVQCNRLDLTFDQTAHRFIHSSTGFVFVCSEPVNDTSYTYLKLEPLTSVFIPKSVLHQPKPELIVNDITNVTTTTTTAAPDRSVLFQFIWYQNANLFPLADGRHEDSVLRGKSWNVISSVISISMSVPVENLTEPIELVFEVPETTKHIVPAYWNYSANGGYGDWRTDGCNIAEKQETLVTVHCYHLTAFAILEDQSEVRANMFQMMEIVVYIGSCVCLLCLMAVIITYVSCFKFLNIPRKMKHSVINISVSVLLLIIGFTMGIKRTDHQRACQIVGIVLHYLSMVAMFWFTVTASNMLKKFTKAEKPPPPPADFPMPLPPKPIIRFYLLAWGVPTIICGITAAVSFDFYDEYEYCFLEWEPGLGAFVGPVGFLILLNCIFFIRISCVIRSSTGPLLNLEETQELPITDIEMTSNRDRIETQSLTSVSVESTVSSVMDLERRPITQLRALAFCLLLYILTWIFGAIAVAKPFSAIPYQEIIFSYLYGVFCAILGIFILIYFCLTRKDSRSSWKRFFLCEPQTLYDANQMTSHPVPQANGHVNTGSGTDISKLNSSVVANHTNHVNQVKKSDDEVSSVNLVPSKPPSLNDGSLSNSLNETSAANFYNPRQNGVAKKFWEKKNKHNSKLLSKEMTKSLNMNGTDSDFSASERPRGVSLGYSSDGNPGQNIINTEPQGRNVDSDPQIPRSPVQPQSPPSYSAVMQNGPFHQYGQPAREQTASPQNQRPEILTGSPNCSIVSYTSSRIVPHHTRTPSSSSLGNRNQTSAFVPVQPRNNTMPRNGKPGSQSMPSSPEREVPDPTTSGPSSVARLGDFDGSSQVSSSYSYERVRSPRPGDLQYLSGYSNPPDMSMYKQYGLIDGQLQNDKTTPTTVPYRNRTNSGGYSSDSSSRHRKHVENSFIQQVEQRIPQGNNVNHLYPNHVNPHFVNSAHTNHTVTNNTGPITHKPPVSPMSESEHNTSRRIFPDSDSQINYKKQRYNDSDHNSEPATKSHKSHDSHKHSRHRGMTKQRSLDWDKQFKDKSPAGVIPYAYVNHNYTDRVLQKLTNMAVTEHIDPTSRAFWVPRSSRSYNEIVKKENARLCEDSSSSSDDDDDDSLDNIWVLQKEKRAKKNKKETSV